MGDPVTIRQPTPSQMLDAGAVGRHCIAEFWGASHLADAKALSDAMTGACRAAGATLLNVFLHEFEPFGGVTGVALLAESHISIHTWPESGYAAIDIFMCGRCDPEVALAELVRHLEPKKTSVRTLVRGISNFTARQKKHGRGFRRQTKWPSKQDADPRMNQAPGRRPGGREGRSEI